MGVRLHTVCFPCLASTLPLHDCYMAYAWIMRAHVSVTDNKYTATPDLV